MNLDKLVDNFVEEYKSRGTYATKEQIEVFANKMRSIIENNKDATPEEMIEPMIVDALNLLNDIRRKYDIPGYADTINVDNINVKIYGGNINCLGEKMPVNALFDVASMTKFYTEVVAYKMMHEGMFKAKDKIAELDDRFINLGDLTVSDVLSFTASFKTDGRLDEKRTIEEAKDTLFKTEVTQTGSYNYNDIGVMIIKELLERVSGKPYEKLVDEYVIKPYNLKDTHLVVPNSKFNLLTGSPLKNARQGLVNDTKAVAFGGYSGHAGIWTTGDDLVKFLRGVYGTVPNISAAYTHGISMARGIMGDTYTTHPKGLDVSYLDKVEPWDSFVIQGSTRVNATGARDAAHNILFNPSSINFEDALEREAKINFERAKKEQNPITIAKQFEFSRDGKLLNVDLIDGRQILPSVDSVERVIAKNAEITIMLRFFNEYLKNYCNYYEPIDIVRNVRQR